MLLFVGSPKQAITTDNLANWGYSGDMLCVFVEANKRVEIIGVEGVCISYHSLMTHFS